MKKSLIAAAGATLAAAAMPMAGVFATAGDTTSTSFTDVVKVSVGSSCTIIPSGGTIIEDDETESGNRTITLKDREFGPYTLMQGHYISNIGGNQIAEDTDDPADGSGTPASAATIVCSAGTGAVAPGEVAPYASGSWVLTAQGTDGETAMKGAAAGANNEIPTGAWSAGTSVWQYKVNGTDAASYGTIPSSATRIAASSTTSGTSLTISPRYRVSASASQAQDTYTGKVTYTLIYTE